MKKKDKKFGCMQFVHCSECWNENCKVFRKWLKERLKKVDKNDKKRGK